MAGDGPRHRMAQDASLTLQIWMSYAEVYNEEVHARTPVGEGGGVRVTSPVVFLQRFRI